VIEAFGQRLGFSPSAAEIQSLPQSLANWRRFPTRLRLCVAPDAITSWRSSPTSMTICSRQRPSYSTPFDAVITAQQARSYKPSLNNFQLALRRIGKPKEKDSPCGTEFVPRCCANARAGLEERLGESQEESAGSRRNGTANIKPDLEVPSLQALAESRRSAKVNDRSAVTLRWARGLVPCVAHN